MDGLNEGFEMLIVEDAVRGIDIDGSVEKAWKEMESAGARIVSSSDVLVS
jgi:nicotinamidase/pyrazinamidase